MQPLLRSAQAQRPPMQGGKPTGAASATLAKQVGEALADPKLMQAIIAGIKNGMPPEKVLAEIVLKTAHASVSAAQQAGVSVDPRVIQPVVAKAVASLVTALAAAVVIPKQAVAQLSQATMKAGQEMFAEVQGEQEGTGPGEVPGEMEPGGM